MINPATDIEFKTMERTREDHSKGVVRIVGRLEITSYIEVTEQVLAAHYGAQKEAHARLTHEILHRLHGRARVHLNELEFYIKLEFGSNSSLTSRMLQLIDLVRAELPSVPHE